MATQTKTTTDHPALNLGEPEPAALPPHRDIPGGICPRCGRPARTGVICGWHRGGKPKGKREARRLRRGEGTGAPPEGPALTVPQDMDPAMEVTHAQIL